MSGTGTEDFRAPTRLTPIAGDQPIGYYDEAAGGVLPSTYFTQMLQRIISYLGQPTENNPPGQTISSQVGDLNELVALAANGPGPAVPGLNARVSAVEAALIRQNLPLPRPPGLNQAQVLSRVWFFR